MYKSILTLVFAISLQCFLYAQSPERENRIEALKIAYITKKLDLNSEESQKFWPIYNDYQKKKNASKPERTKNEDVSNLSEAEAGKLIDQHLAYEEKELALKKSFINDLKGVISNAKIVMLTRTERQFRKELINNMNRRKGIVGRQGQGKNGSEGKRGN